MTFEDKAKYGYSIEMPFVLAQSYMLMVVLMSMLMLYTSLQLFVQPFVSILVLILLSSENQA